VRTGSERMYICTRVHKDVGTLILGRFVIEGPT
jgi:hypothetical protein